MTMAQDDFAAKIAARVVARVVKAEVDPDFDAEGEVGDLDVAEYLVFLLSLDTYMRYVHEKVGPDATDDVIKKGIALVRRADRAHVEAIATFLDGHLPSINHKKMLGKAFRYMPNREGLPRRALQLRTLLSRGGPPTMRAVFKTNKALQEVRIAMAAAANDDADAALDKLAVIPVRNVLLRNWIDQASQTAGSGTFQNPVSAGAAEAMDQRQKITEAQLSQVSQPTSSEAFTESKAKKDDLLIKLQQDASDSARKAMVVSGEPDVPPTRSEVIGIATAAATAVATNIDSPELAEVFQVGGYPLDDEQRAAAVTDGRVLVAAGAGAGKSTTLISRLKYLIKIKRVSPSRIMVTTFNKNAADELKVKVAKELGSNVASAITIGTMHSTFRAFIRGGNGQRGFGTEAEKALVANENLIGKDERDGKKKDEEEETVVVDEEGNQISTQQKAPTKPPTSSQVTYAVRGIIKDIGPAGLARMTKLPPQLFEKNPDFSAKGCKQWMENWRGNGVDFDTARKGATTIEEVLASVWMEIYHGIKGDLGPSWEPVAASSTFGRFMNKFRPAPNRRRLGDPDDMIKVFRDILKRDPAAKKAAQQLYDHVLVDEAQDLNIVQHEIFGDMTEDIEPGSGQSFWIVGDDKQAIYQFRGARPALFTGLKDKPEWEARLIQTNYRCDPEIVEAANALSQNNTNQIPMQAVANPQKPRGRANLEVKVPPSYSDIADDVISGFESEKQLSREPWTKYAVLSRNNSELNAFEDQCILHEIPYKRSKGTGFLESHESNTVLGYMDLAMSSDNTELQEALIATINKPDRGLYLSQDAIKTLLRDAYKAISRKRNINVRDVNPLELLTNEGSADRLAEIIKQPMKAMKIESARRLARSRGQEGGDDEWMFWQDVEELKNKFLEMGRQVTSIRRGARAGMSTTQMLDTILDEVKSELGYRNLKKGVDTRKVTSLRQQIKSDISFNRDPDDDDAPEKVETKVVMGPNGMRRVVEVDSTTGEEVDPLNGLGTVRYLYQLAEPNENDKALGVDPSTGDGLYRKIDRYKQLSKTLQDPAKHPERLTLSTVHSVKGAQWKHTALCMSYGFFPGNRQDKNVDLESELAKMGATLPWSGPDREEAKAKSHAHIEDPMTAERNLAYVGVTRAETDLQIICSQERVPKKLRENGPVVSQFVREARLQIGQNVNPVSPQKDSGEESVEVKTACASWVFAHEDADLDRYLEASDISTSYTYGRTL